MSRSAPAHPTDRGMRGRVRLRSAGAPGRVRLAVDGLRRRPEAERSVAARLGRLPGVHRVEPSALTGNVLLEFQPERWTPRSLLLASGRARGIKDYKSLRCRTPFGKLALTSPRLRHCRCEAHQQASFSPLLALLPERTAPVAPAVRYGTRL